MVGREGSLSPQFFPDIRKVHLFAVLLQTVVRGDDSIFHGPHPYAANKMAGIIARLSGRGVIRPEK